MLFTVKIEEVYGFDEVDRWLYRISQPDTDQSPYSPQNNHKWWLSTARIDGDYPWGHVFDFGKTKMHVIGAPGHSEGFCCMHFPDYGFTHYRPYRFDISFNPLFSFEYQLSSAMKKASYSRVRICHAD